MLVARQGKSLQSTIDKYNKLVASMNPPKPSLMWKDIMNLNFLSNIILLHSREDIWEKPWFKLHFCEAMHAWYKLQHACEELKIIRIKAHQIWASMNKEEAHLNQAIEATQSTDLELPKYLSLVFKYQLNANRHLCSKLLLLEKQGR